MTTTAMDYMEMYPSTPTKHIIQGEISNVTKQPRQPYFDLTGIVLRLSPYLTRRLNNASLHGISSNQLIDVSTAIDISSENSTVDTTLPKEVEDELSALIYSIRDSTHDDILDSDLAKSLTAIVDHFGSLVFNVLYTWIGSNQIDPASSSDLVILIGRIETIQNRSRLDFLERCLRLQSSVRVRYASILALAYVDDRSTSLIESIKCAIENEPIRSLQKDMHQLLAQLEKPRRR